MNWASGSSQWDECEEENEHGRDDSIDGGRTEHGIADKDALAEFLAEYHVRERNAPRPCDQCGKQFEPKRADARFCGERCNWTYQNERDKERRREKNADKQCVECGETFEALKGHAKFCGVKCRNRHNDRKRALAKEASRFVCEEVPFKEAAE